MRQRAMLDSSPHRIVMLIAVFSAWSSAGHARAELVTFLYQATVNSVSDSQNLLQGTIASGSQLAGLFAYDTDIESGSFVSPPGNNDIRGQAGGFSFNSDIEVAYPFGGFFPLVSNNAAGVGDELSLLWNVVTTPVTLNTGGVEVIDARVRLRDSTGTALSSLLLPSRIDFSRFGVHTLDIVGRNTPGTSTRYTISATLTNLAFRSGLSGDGNGDCQVGAGDYAVWAAQFGRTSPFASADYDRSGVVGTGDYVLWAANFGKSCAPAASVPEPAAGALMAVGLVLGALGLRRRACRYLAA